MEYYSLPLKVSPYSLWYTVRPILIPDHYLLHTLLSYHPTQQFEQLSRGVATDDSQASATAGDPMGGKSLANPAQPLPLTSSTDPNSVHPSAAGLQKQHERVSRGTPHARGGGAETGPERREGMSAHSGAGAVRGRSPIPRADSGILPTPGRNEALAGAGEGVHGEKLLPPPESPSDDEEEESPPITPSRLSSSPVSPHNSLPPPGI